MTSYISGPYAGQLLGDLGADVIKLEPPGGDELRNRGKSRTPKMGATFMNVNRNKRSVVLDLKDKSNLNSFYDLVRSADVFLHNMRPPAVARLGASYDDLRAVRDDIIFCQIVGFGTGGPYEGRPAFEDIVQGVSAFASLQGETVGEPTYAACAMVDTLAGIYAAKSILAALLHRERTGEGQAVEIPMFETAISFFMTDHMWDRTFDRDGQVGNPRYLTPHRRPFKTKDGHLCMVLATQRHFEAFFSAGRRPELMEDPRFATNVARSINADDLYSAIGEIFAERTTAEWTEILDKADLPVMPINSMADLFTDPHLTETGFFQNLEHPTEGAITLMAPPVRFSRSPTAIYRQPPSLGEHTTEVLAAKD
jgi:crotonobetainyl-CoA:carnitine CoA-transferase CaiB-like acyl-CoA transferase